MQIRLKECCRVFVGLLGLGLAMFLVACGGTAPAPGEPVLLLQNDAKPDLMMALLAGKLSVVDSCWQIKGEGDVAYTPVWPAGYSLRMDGETANVLDSSGRVVARSGAAVSLGGGEIPAEQIEGYVSETPVKCPGPYWVVSSVSAQ